MTEWECADCGLVHRHDTSLHLLWDKIDWEYCKKLEYNPACNCGHREAQVRGFWDNPAPALVPAETETDIITKFG